MRYLVTGGLGVIGSLCARELIAEGNEVTIIDDGADARHICNSPTNAQAILHQRIEDIAPSILAEIVGDQERVLHAAASTGIPYSADAPLDDITRNVAGTVALLEALRKSPRPTAMLSSVKPYGLERLSHLERPTHYELSGDGVDESYPLSPDEPYAASKAAQSLIAQAYARSYGLKIAVFRCSNLYGPAACHGPRHGWLTWFCIQAALGWPIEIQGAGNQTRDMLYWSDVLGMCERAWDRCPAGRGDIINIGGGRHNTTSPLAAVATLRSLGATVETTHGPGRWREDPLFVTNIAAAENVYGWRPHVNVEDGIAKVYEWAQKNRAELAEVYAAEAP